MSDVPRNNFEIIGLSELIRDLRMFGGQKTFAIMHPVVNRGGDILLEKTREKVPVNTGKLKENLYLKRNKNKKALISNTLTWDHDEVGEYPAHLELGHGLVYMGSPTGIMVAPRPYLRPAADESAEEIFELLVDGMNKALEELGDK